MITGSRSSRHRRPWRQGDHCKVQDVFDQKQHHRCRQRLLAEREQQQWQSHVASVLEHHWRQQGLRVVTQPTRDRPAEQARAKHDDQTAERDHLNVGQIDGLARQRGKDQCGHEYAHVDLVSGNHVRTMLAAVQEADCDDREHWENNAHDLDEHRGSFLRLVGVSRSLWCRSRRGNCG